MVNRTAPNTARIVLKENMVQDICSRLEKTETVLDELAPLIKWLTQLLKHTASRVNCLLKGWIARVDLFSDKCLSICKPAKQNRLACFDTVKQLFMLTLPK